MREKGKGTRKRGKSHIGVLPIGDKGQLPHRKKTGMVQRKMAYKGRRGNPHVRISCLILIMHVN